MARAVLKSSQGTLKLTGCFGDLTIARLANQCDPRMVNEAVM